MSVTGESTWVLDTARLDDLAAAFAVLGRFHLEPPGPEALATFWQMLAEWPLPDTNDAREGLRLLRSAQSAAETAEQVRADHARLYGTLAVAVVAPYESVHRGQDGLVFDEHTLEVREAYRFLALQAPRLNREPDDHIGLELEFVSQSCLRAIGALEQGSQADAERYVRHGADFLRTHLLEWAPEVLEIVAAEARTDVMRGLAYLTLGALTSYRTFVTLPG